MTLIVLKDLSTLSVFLLAGYNIAYFIAAVVVGHKIWKKYHVDEPELPPESSNASIPQSVEKVEEGTEADELIKYKRLYENGIISKADFNKKKKEILFGKKIDSPEDKEKKRKITLIVLTSLAIAAFFVGFMLGLFEEYIHMKERYTLLDAFGTDKGLGIALLLILLSLSMLAFESLILVDAIKPLFKRKLKRHQ